MSGRETGPASRTSAVNVENVRSGSTANFQALPAPQVKPAAAQQGAGAGQATVQRPTPRSE